MPAITYAIVLGTEEESRDLNNARYALGDEYGPWRSYWIEFTCDGVKIDERVNEGNDQSHAASVAIAERLLPEYERAELINAVDEASCLLHDYAVDHDSDAETGERTVKDCANAVSGALRVLRHLHDTNPAELNRLLAL